MKLKSTILLASLAIFSISCSDFLEPGDNQYINSEGVADVLDRSSDAIIQGVYSRSIEYGFSASRHDDFGQKSIDLSVDLSTEDMVHYANKQWFVYDYQMDNRMANYARSIRQWKYCYANIRDLNSIITVLEAESELSDEQKHLMGEALALRAHHYFILINLFQTAGKWNDVKDLPGVPVYTETSLEGKARGTVADVYQQIKSDYETAVTLLEGFETDANRVGQIAAKALYARAAMYYEDYATAKQMASDVIDATSLMSTSEYKNGFGDIANVEWLWGVDITAENSTSYASFFSIIDPTSPGYGGALGQYKCIDKRLYDAISANDIRKQCFKDGSYSIPYLQYKFIDKSGSFLADLVYLRTAEQYYIKAEVQAREGDIQGAQKTLDIISSARSIDGKNPYQWASTANELIDQIFVQKRIELWGEGMSLYEFNRLEKTIDRTYEGTNHPDGNIAAGDVPILWHNPLRTLQIPTKEIEGNDKISDSDQNP